MTTIRCKENAYWKSRELKKEEEKMDRQDRIK